MAPIKVVVEFNNGSWRLRLGTVWMTAPNPPVGPQMVNEEFKAKMYAARINAEIDGGVAAFGCDVEARGASYSDGDKIGRCGNWCGLERCAVSLKCATPTASMADAAEAVNSREAALREALGALVENEGLDAFVHLDKGIGTATASGKRWLAARAALASTEPTKD